MSKISNNPSSGLLRRFFRDERGSTAIEYALIGSLIAVFLIVAIGTVGATLRDNFYAGYADALAGNTPSD